MQARCSVVVFLTLIASCCLLFAQGDLATLTGIVSDPSGAVLVNASVKLTNEDTNIVQAANTNAAGLFSFPTLMPGRYQLTVNHQGFKASVKNDLVLHVGDNVSQ